MNIRVKDYLEDLSKCNLPRENGVILLDNSAFVDDYQSDVHLKHNVLATIIGDKSYFTKFTNHTSIFSDQICENSEVVNSSVYNELGVNCADYYPIIMRTEIGSRVINTPGIISQDLKGICGYSVVIPLQTAMYQDCVASSGGEIINNNYWTILKMKDRLVGKYMTEECFNELVNMFLLDVFSTQRDRHYANYFLYKGEGEPLWQGVIAIDNALTLQTTHYDRASSAKQLCEQIWEHKYSLMRTFQNTSNMQSCSSRIQEINRLIQDGSFNTSQIELLKSILSYDITSTISRTEKDKHIIVSQTQKDLMQYMWERMQNSLEV